ncbi:MAG: ribosomal-processing cysteine protease Prp [Lachnospiraceae bacterium]|nr:ribosomal-processing cysteine protease Prp [Lachnospiraceae bacterium]
MIQVTFYKNQTGEWKGFSIKGHAGYAEYGKDIVCAAVSALALNTLNSIEALTEDTFKAEVAEGSMKMKFTSVPGSSSKVLMDSLQLGLQNILEDNNKTYIQLNFKEV